MSERTGDMPFPCVRCSKLITYAGSYAVRIERSAVAPFGGVKLECAECATPQGGIRVDCNDRQEKPIHDR